MLLPVILCLVVAIGRSNAAGACNGQTCDENASCETVEGTDTCVCNTGYEGGGESCTDVNECDSKACGSNCDDCHSEASCKNAGGSFTCSCDTGYTGTGVTCTDINECEGGSHNCGDGSECDNTPNGSFSCNCLDGYKDEGDATDDGLDCSDIVECGTKDDNCDGNTKCVDAEGTFSCVCKTGYAEENAEGNPEGIRKQSVPICNDVDECDDAKCGNNCDNCHSKASCANTEGSFKCSCNSGYTGNGVSCKKKDDGEEEQGPSPSPFFTLV